MKAALYCRISKEDIDKMNSGDDSESIKNQRAMLMEFAKSKGYEIYKIYTDEDYSGLDSARPAFLEMLSDAKEQRFNAVICKSQSRFTRDILVAESYINNIFPVLGIRFLSITDGTDSFARENKKARQINALINEWYVEDLSENIRAVLRQKMDSGCFIGSFAPYGYKKDAKNPGKLIKDEEAAKVVLEIFKMYAAGKSRNEICAKLNGKGIKTPTEYKKSHGEKYKNTNAGNLFWSPSTIKKILSNETYMGFMIQGKSRKISYKSEKTKAVPKESWIKLSDCHEAIIDKELFYEVRKRAAARQKNGHPS
ncbi:MAG: recombinase family protein [Lachnospiraceae bacterium]|nr:recombinase family protein [Lachnospiraceae bacterium]